MTVSAAQLKQMFPECAPVADTFAPALSKAMAKYDINTVQRKAAFLGQLAHESGNFLFKVESLNYKASALVGVFGSKRITQAQADKYGRTDTQKADQKAIANIVYGGDWGRANLGNTGPDDGYNFRGRGPIQTTGRSNYKRVGDKIGVDLVFKPELLEVADNGCMAAAVHWSDNKLNALADAWNIDDIGSIINTGKPGRVAKGNDDRVAKTKAALKVLGG